MKINSENLYDYINELATNEKVKFKVFYNDDYITDVFWDGKDFNWESGTFTSGAFFDPFYDFVPIEEDNKIEKIDMFDYFTGYWYKELPEDFKKHLENNFETLNEIINKIIDRLNKESEK